MKHFYEVTLMVLGLIVISLTSFSQEKDTIFIDFGTSNNSSSPNWNNVVQFNAGVSLDYMVNSKGEDTGISLTLSDAFSGVNTNGLEADASLNFPFSATGDSFFGRIKDGVGDLEPTGGITLSNLNPDETYDLTLFGSRKATDNRSTKYVVEGATSNADSINCASNTSDVAVISGIKPKADGTIVITASPGAENDNGSGYYYLGVVQIVAAAGATQPDDTKIIRLTVPNGGEYWEVGKTADIKWDARNITNAKIEYTIDEGANWNTLTSEAQNGAYTWTIPNEISGQCKVRVSDATDQAVFDESDDVFQIVADDGLDFHIVVLGSSTAAGTGPTTKDSSWVWMYREYLTNKYNDFELTNLAVGGYNTYNILPTGYQIPSSVNQTIRVNNNITKALSLNPDAIIINLPSNDAASGFPVEDQLVNYDTISKLAAANNVPLWVCTPQPRTFNEAKDQIQLDMVDSTFSIFGEKTIDFWNGFHTDEYDILPEFNTDNVHMNNAGHKLLVERIIAAGIDTYILDEYTDYIKVSSQNITLSFEAGIDTTLIISSDVEWTITTDAEWLEIDKTSGIGNETIVIKTKSENAEQTDKTASLKISSPNADDVEITVVQLSQTSLIFALTVNSGTGSGEYAMDMRVEITANAPEATKEFKGWTGDTAYVDDVNELTTMVTMPEKDITLTATYQTSGISDQKQMSITVSPNPANNYLIISNTASFSEVNIYSIQGKFIQSHIIDANELTLDISSLKKGLYLFQLKGIAGEATKNVIID